VSVEETLSDFHRVMALMGEAFAHELNNLLQGVVGFLDLIVRTEQDENRRKDLEFVLESTLKCREFAVKVGDLSERHPARRVEVSVEPLVRSVAAFCAKQHGDPDVKVSVEAAGEVATLVTDPALVTVALFGLLDNAFQALPGKGEIKVSCVSADEGEWALSIADDGKGMAREMVDRAGQPFATDKGGPAAGVGLWFARRVSKILGGRMHVTSGGSGKGTTVTLSVPLEPEE
jgi:signal transduction histidine kinase